MYNYKLLHNLFILESQNNLTAMSIAYMYLYKKNFKKKIGFESFNFEDVVYDFFFLSFSCCVLSVDNLLVQHVSFAFLTDFMT